MALLRFLGSTWGRVARIVVGVALITVGIAIGGAWLIVSAVGLVPLAAGAFDICLLGPLARLPMRGEAFRTQCSAR